MTGALQMRHRLLYASPTTGFFLSHRLPLALAALEAGYDVAVASPEGPDTQALTSHGLQHFHVPFERSLGKPGSSVRAFAALAGVMHSFRPDLAHLITAKPAVLGGIAARLFGIPTVAAVTGLGYLFIRSDWKARAAQQLLFAGYRLGLDRSDAHFIFQNGDDLGLFREAGLLARAGHTRIPGSGVDLERIAPRPLPPGPPVVLLPARMLRDKGVIEFVAAARILRERGVEARFRLLGDPDPGNPASLTHEELVTIDREGLVEWRPYTPDIAQALAEAHLVVLPSHREGFPKTLIDAAAAGRATVTNDLTGCRDAIVPDMTGLLCKPHDPTSLADCIERLVLNRSFLEALGKEGRAHAERTFDVRSVVATHLEIYHQVLSHP